MSVFDKILQKKYSRMPKDSMLDLEESEETEPATIENSVIKAKNQPLAAPKLPDYKKLAEAKPAAPKPVDKQLKDEEKAAKAIEKDADVGSSVDALVGGANPSQATPGYGPVAYKPYKFEKTDFGQDLRAELKEIAGKYDTQLKAISDDATRKESRIQMKKVLKDLVDAAALLYLANNSPEAQIKTGGQSEEMQAELSRLDNLVKQRQSIVKDQFRELRDAIKSQYAQKEKDELAKLGIENKNIDLENQALAQQRAENIAESRYQRKLGADISDREDRQRHAREMLELSQAGKTKAAATKAGAGGEGKTPEAKQFQYKSAMFGKRIAQSLNDFADIEKAGYDRSDISSGVGKWAPNILRTDEAVRQEQAERNFINAILRRESGAVIADSEFENAEKQYFPRVGDGKGTLEQKRRNREQVLEALKTESGPAWEQVQAVIKQGEDPKIQEYAKRYNMPYKNAETILRNRGYGK